MLPSSGRVKLNRNVLKVECNGLPTVPRRRRSIKLLNTDLTVGKTQSQEYTLLPNQDNSKSEVTAKVESVAEGALPAAVGRTASGLPSVAECSNRDRVERSSPRSECKGMAISKRDYFKCKGQWSTGDNFEVKVEGPCTRSKYVQGKVEGPKTRSKSTSSLNGVTGKNGFCCSWQFALCFGGDSTSKKTDPRDKRSQLVSHYFESDVSVKSRVSVNRADIKNRDIARASPLVKEDSVHRKRRSVCSPKTKRRRKRFSSPRKLATKIRRERKGQCEVENISSVSARGRRESNKCCLTSAGQDDVQIVKRTHSLPHGSSNIDRRANVSPYSLKPNLRASSDRSVRRAVKISCCALCDDIKYTPPRRRKVVLAEPERASIGSEQPRVRIKTRKTNTDIIKAPKKLVIWIGKYPKVKLCDIAKICDGSVQDFHCVLPAGLTTKVVRCFKRVVLGPSCQGGERHGSEKASCLSREEPYHCTQCGESFSRPQRVASTNPTASILLAGGASEASTNCSASLSLGKRASKGASGAGMLDRDVEEDPGAESDVISARGLMATEKWHAKRMRLGDGRGDATVSLAPKRVVSSRHDSEVCSGVTTSESGGDGMGYVMSSDFQLGLDGRIDCSKPSDLPVRTHCSGSQDDSQRKGPRGSDASLESSEIGLFTLSTEENGLGHHSDSDTAKPEMFSCQRVMAYVSRLPLSCARTYTPWPFPKCGPSSDCNGSPPTKSFLSVNGGLIDGHEFSPVSLDRTSVAPTHHPATDYTPRANQVSTQKRMKEREHDQRIGIEGRGKERDTQCSLSPSRSSKGSLSLLAVAKEPLSHPSPPITDYLSSTKDQSETYTISTVSRGDTDTVSTLFEPKDGGEADTTHFPGPASTPSPVGLSDTDTATASSPLLFSSTLRAMSPRADTTTTPSTTPIFPRNKNMGRGVDMTYISSPTASSPTPKHMNEADATSNLTPSRDDSETDTAYTLSPESSPPSPNCLLQSPESFVRSSESSLLLPQEEGETEEEAEKGRERGNEELDGMEEGEEILWEGENSDTEENLPDSETCSPQRQKLHHKWLTIRRSDQTVEYGPGSSPLSKPIERVSEPGMDVPPPGLPLSSGGPKSVASLARLLLRTQSYSDDDDVDDDQSSDNGDGVCSGSKPTSEDQPPKLYVAQLLIDTLSYAADEEEEDVNGKDDEDVLVNVPSVDHKARPSIAGDILPKPHTSPSDDDDGACDDPSHSSVDERLNPSTTGPLVNGQTSTDEDDTTGDEGEEESLGQVEKAGSEVQPAVGPRNDLLDEVTAYEQDILVLDVIQDDPELFGNLPQERALNLGPTRGGVPPSARIMKTLPTRIGGPSWSTKKSSTTGATGIPADKTDQRRVVIFKDAENRGRSWRPVSSTNLMHSNSWPPTDNRPHEVEGQLDNNNNTVKPDSSERAQAIQTLNSLKSTLPPLMDVDSWSKALIKNPVDGGDLRQSAQKAIGVNVSYTKTAVYCRYYFSDNLPCNYKTCWFLHVPKEGDEKFCVEIVLRFSRSPNPTFLQKAVAVFTAYYQNNPPGMYFTPPVFTSLLSALLKAGLFSDILSVLNVSTAHKILPSPGFLLVLFDYVREQSLHSLIPELLRLTSKMVNAGLPLSMEDCDRVLHSLGFQHLPQVDVFIPVCGNHRLPPSGTPTLEAMNLSSAILEIELCTQQEDWARMGIVFQSVCHSQRSLNDLQRFSGQVAVVLLSETKDRLALPFAAFSETVCQEDCGDGLTKSFLGRIGVSLMFRYYKTQQWAKGRRLVEVLSRLKVNYSTLKGLFGNEDGASRCRLVTMATELFLKSGSVEGALNTLRDNEWFLSTSAWPCEAGDAAERSSVLVQLAGKTSHRDTLEVLSNLPGLKEPTDLADASQYCGLFNSHLGACVERQTLTVASDTLDFMLSKTLAVDPALLHTLLHKLGKQNHWLRARALFKHALGVGYYPGISAQPGSLALAVPCPLGEIEIALAFEMFITVNAAAILNTTETSPSLNITLKRTRDSESEYLAAGSCLLSAAVIPNPKLTVRYTAVSSSQEQLFTLDTPSARRWLRHNRTWANEMWTHCS